MVDTEKKNTLNNELIESFNKVSNDILLIRKLVDNSKSYLKEALSSDVYQSNLDGL